MKRDEQPDYAEMGREVGRAIQGRIAGNRAPPRRFPKRGTRLPTTWGSATDLGYSGYAIYMANAEAKHFDHARERWAEERVFWRQRFLERVEEALARETDPHTVLCLKAELRKVQRALGIKPTKQTIREQTRDRVRRHRARG